MSIRFMAVVAGLACVVACAQAPEEDARGPRPQRVQQHLDLVAVCDHSICQTGGPLGLACDPCSAQLCGQDPYCCTDAWDATCVGEVGSICGQSCTAPPDAGGGPSTCAHAICATGGALVASCNACATTLCGQDPYCCGVTWDATCVGEVASICGQSCP